MWKHRGTKAFGHLCNTGKSNILVVSQRWGHASIAFTLDTYSHVLPGLQEAAAEAFDRMLDPDVSKMLAKEGDSNGGAGGTRTPDLLTASQTLSL